MKYWSGYLQNVPIFRIFNFSDLRSVQFSTRPIITLWGNYSFAHNVWTKGDTHEWNGHQSILSCGPESSDTQYDQLWPDLTCDSKLDVGQILKLSFLAKLGITQFVSTRETGRGQIRYCRTNSLEVIVEKLKIWKIVLHPNTFWSPAPKRLTWCQIWELTPNNPVHCTYCLFFRIVSIALSLGARPCKAMPCTFNQKWRKWCIDWWRHLTLKMLIQGHEIFTRKSSYVGHPPLKFGVSSSSGSRESRGALYAHPLQGA